MKRILTLLCVVAFGFQAQAQVLFSQDFESGTLAPMTAVDKDGKTVNTNVSGIAGPTFQVVQQTATNKMVVSTSWFTPPGIADDWLISPALTIPDSNYFLIWEAYSPDAAYRDGYEVRISTTDNQTPSFTTVVLDVDAETTTISKRAVNMNAYVGQTIYFAFRNNSNDKFLLFMDNIQVVQLKKNNLVLRNVNFEKYNAVGTQIPIQATIENYSADTVNSYIFEYIANGIAYRDTVTDAGLDALRTTDITHTVSLPLDTEGEVEVSVSILLPNGEDDSDPYDNSVARNAYGLVQALPKKVVVEEGTGTWCGWCPRGFVAMEKIAVDYAGIVIPIAVHNFDPMVVPEYDTPFSQTISGYPSGNVDRKENNIDPDNPDTGYGFDDAIENLQDRLIPVSVSVEALLDEVSRTVTITGTGSTPFATNSNSLRFLAVLTEDGIVGTTAAYDQVNYYANNAAGPMGGFESMPNPVLAANIVYNFVARAILGGYEGAENSIPDATAANEEFTFEFTYDIPAEYNVDNMKAIVMILDEQTGEILNSQDAEIITTAVPVVPQGTFAVYPNPTSDVLNLEVDYQTDVNVSLKVYNTYGKLVRDLGQLDLSNGKQIRQINVADLASGNYILEMRHKNTVNAMPFTKI